MTIRRATVADRPGLLRMALSFVASQPYGVQAHALIADEACLRALIDVTLDRGVIFVAAWRDGLHGMLAAQAYPHPMTGELTVSEIAWWVDETHRHTSAGMRLLMAIHDYAERLGATVIQMVAPAVSSVGGIYARLGYAPLETTWQRRLAAAREGPSMDVGASPQPVREPCGAGQRSTAPLTWG